MVPTEYRLEQVAARLTERLESTRRSYAGDPDGAAATFGRLADEIVENAVAEYTADGFVDDPERHARFLESEIRETFLPRYSRLAVAMTQREESGYGVGFLYGPIGRVAMFVMVLVIGVLMLRVPGPWGVKLAPMVPLLIGMFVPDLLAWAARRRYRKELVSVLEDMRHIQDRAGDYITVGVETPAETRADADPAAERGRKAAGRERQSN